MLPLYAAAIFLAAALLFVVQPMVGKGLLPLLGGAPAVWTTCMLFFQVALLAGYAYAHGLTRRFGGRAQVGVHAVVLTVGVAATWAWAARGRGEPADTDPILWLLMVLTLGIGPGFFAVASAGPLLQRWFSRTGHRASADPYFLYAASNAGSLIGLVGYPLLLEPGLALPLQGRAWAIGLSVFAVLAVVCGVAAARPVETPAKAPATASDTPAGSRWPQRGRWVFLAFVPSSLLLAVTTYISTDVAAVPLLWVVPLALYLISFILAFGRLGGRIASGLRVPTAIAIVLAGVMQLAAIRSGVVITAGVALGALGLVALYAHARLAVERPPVSRLTEFYLLISVGGALGGLFNAVVAPLVFDRPLEYAVTLVAAAAVLPWGADAAGRAGSSRDILARYGLPLGLAVYSVLAYAVFYETLSGSGAVVLLAFGAVPVVAAIFAARRGATLALCVLVVVGSGEAAKLIFADRVLDRERTFFGTHRVEVAAINPDFPDLTFHTLSHGTTLHGVQLRPRIPDERPEGLSPGDHADLIAFREELERVPTSYYHRSGPLGEVFRALHAEQPERPLSIAAIGLGAGSLAAYGRPDDAITFIEIDPAIVRIASDPDLFTFLDNTEAETEVILGDGRLRMAELPENAFDLIVLDAFSSDAVPAHLLTVEAFELYESRLKPGGLIAVHISNRVLNLQRIISPAADRLGLIAALRDDDTITPEQDSELKRRSLWMVVARERGDLVPLARQSEQWGIRPRRPEHGRGPTTSRTSST